MKKLTESTKGDDLGTPSGRDNGEGQAGKTSEFSKKLPLPAIETDPAFPATVLSAATMHIRHKPALQRDIVQTTTKPKFHRQLSAQRKADLPRLIPGRCSPSNLHGRHGPCGDLPHRTVEGSNKRDRSSGSGSSQKHLVNPPWAPCKVVDPTYIGNIYFDRLPKGLKHLEPVDLCHRHGHHRRLNPLGKAQNEGTQRRSCTNLRAHVHKQKVQEKKVVPVAVVKTEASTDDKPEDVDVGGNRNRNILDIDADSKARTDPVALLKRESSFVSSTEYQTDINSRRSYSSVSKEQGETFPRESCRVTEQSCQMPSSANGDCQPQSTASCQTIPACKLAENLQQTTHGFLSKERVEKESLTFSVSSENSLSDDELKVPDANPCNKNSSKPHIERRGSLSSCLPKGKLRTDEVSKSFSALSSKEKELVDVGKTNLKHTMPHHEHRGEMVEKHVCTDVAITEETFHVVPEFGDNARREVKTTGQQQDDTSHDMSSLGSTVVGTPVPKLTTSLTNVNCLNTETETDLSDEPNKLVLDSFANTTKTQHGDSQSVCDTKIPSHKLLSLSDEVSKGIPGDPPKVVMRSKVPVRSLAGKIHEPSTKNITKQTLPPAFQNDPSKESSGSVGRHRPEQEKLKYSKVSQDEPIDPTSTGCKVDRACTNKTSSKLKIKTKKAANSATANSATAKLKETSAKRDSDTPKPIIEENTLCPNGIKAETVLFGPGSQLETVDPDTDQESSEVHPDLAIGVKLTRTPVDEVRPRVSDLEIQLLNKENRPPSEAHTEGEHETFDVGEKVDNVISDTLPMIQRNSKEDCTAAQEKESLPVVEAVPKRQPVVAEDTQNDQHMETCGRVMDKEKVILTKPEEVVITDEEDNVQNETKNGVTSIATDVNITPQSNFKNEMDNEKNVQRMTERSEVDGGVDIEKGESLTMYVPPLPCSSATQEFTTAGLSQDRSPCRWRINLDANRLDHLLQVQDNLCEDGSRGRGDWKERPVNYVDPNVPLEDMLTKYFTDHTPLDSAFRAINIINSYSSSISYNSHHAQERVVEALQSIKQEEVYKHAVICPLASQCANATREFGESLYKAFRRFSNRSRAAQEAMIEYYRALAEGEITSPEMVKQIKRDGRKLYMVWEGGRYVTRYAEDDECTGSSDETIADDDTTGSSLTHNHNPASDRE